MTTQEKAKDLFNKMKGFRVKHSHSKKCAKIAVEEILLSEKENHSCLDETYEYWLDVKSEIEKL